MIPETNARIQADRKLAESGYMGGLSEINKGLSCMEELNKSALENGISHLRIKCLKWIYIIDSNSQTKNLILFLTDHIFMYGLFFYAKR